MGVPHFRLFFVAMHQLALPTSYPSSPSHQLITNWLKSQTQQARQVQAAKPSKDRPSASQLFALTNPLICGKRLPLPPPTTRIGTLVSSRLSCSSFAQLPTVNFAAAKHPATGRLDPTSTRRLLHLAAINRVTSLSFFIRPQISARPDHLPCLDPLLKLFSWPGR